MGNAEESRTIEQVVQRTGCSFCFVPMSKWDLKPEQSEHKNMNNAVKMTGCTSYFGDAETTIPKTKGSGFRCVQKELVFTIVITKPSLTGRSVQSLPCVLTPAKGLHFSFTLCRIQVFKISNIFLRGEGSKEADIFGNP